MNVCHDTLELACPPVLFLVFNRPDLAKHVFERIRAVRPVKLFVAVDGPRSERIGEAELCAESRRVVDQIDWPCEVKTLFRDQNLGCKRAVSTAITWFFENVEEGVILEDDCVPDLSFFRFCAELLSRYRYDMRIMAVSGDNFQEGVSRTSASYYFSKYPLCWGWATWRRAWEKMDVDMRDWPQVKQSRAFRKWFYSRKERRYWITKLENTFAGNIDTWDYSWNFTCWKNNGLAILPDVNLVQNIGFDERATHTVGGGAPCSARSQSLRFPLVHPTIIKVNRSADIFTDRIMFSGLVLHMRLRKWRWKVSAKLRRQLNQMLTG